jgi:hypothetical protein
MADVKDSELPAGAALDGTEIVAVVQAGANVQTTAQDIADLAVAGGGAGDVDLIARQGGSATSWATSGTTSQILPSKIVMQVGSLAFNNGGASGASFPVTFPTAFAQAPLVVVTLSSLTVDGRTLAYVSAAPTTTGFTVVVQNTAGTTGVTGVIYWQAIGEGV